MNTYFAIAAAFATFNAGLHFFLGGKTIARPLLEATGLPDKVRCVQYFCWHIATLTLILQAVLLGVAAVAPAETGLAIVGTAVAASVGLLGIGMPPFLQIGYGTMPQGWLFVPVTGLGLAGLFL
ncbi:hypothetical protein [Eilatimonas milleporae]|uniref:DUF423 domain-containing protein n=1 Tax=Eilatimonas milleporae TaxID=911205 RepID=A0A3M0CHC9_9PROT|nr:hypothetical protein [Eilatimonas milleporae]RMB08742.1 hypothetical protein BXY39_1381 [Eilatimonas milleporae]